MNQNYLSPCGWMSRAGGFAGIDHLVWGWPHLMLPAPPPPATPRQCDRPSPSSPPPPPRPLPPPVPCLPLPGPSLSPHDAAVGTLGECPPWRLPPPPSRRRSLWRPCCRTCRRSSSRPRCSAGAWKRRLCFLNEMGYKGITAWGGEIGGRGRWGRQVESGGGMRTGWGGEMFVCPFWPLLLRLCCEEEGE